MLAFAEAVRSGGIRGSDGRAFDLVVNIGIGGSDLGPAMAVEALRPVHAQGAPRIAFVSNVDGIRLADVLATADPARTLFIVCSKTFTTQETRTNARHRARVARRASSARRRCPSTSRPCRSTRRRWMPLASTRATGSRCGTGSAGAIRIWSSIGVSLAIAIGARHFEEFLAGAAAMDEHFRAAPWQQNLPVLMAMLGVWNINFLNLPTLAVLPYDDRLARFPAYLQQLDMESNGKSRPGRRVADVFCKPRRCIWGEPGNNAQHSFFQMLHQGTPRAALDFILPAQSSCGNQDCAGPGDRQLSGAGRGLRLRPALDGSRSDALRIACMTATGLAACCIRSGSIRATLGSLIALYEHKVFVQSVVWGINAFDQWGVELGKKLAQAIEPLLGRPMPRQSAAIPQIGDHDDPPAQSMSRRRMPPMLAVTMGVLAMWSLPRTGSAHFLPADDAFCART